MLKKPGQMENKYLKSYHINKATISNVFPHNLVGNVAI